MPESEAKVVIRDNVSLSEVDLIVDTLGAVSFIELEGLINFKKQV